MPVLMELDKKASAIVFNNDGLENAAEDCAAGTFKSESKHLPPFHQVSP